MKTTQHTKMLAAMAMVAATVFLLSACGDDDPAKPTASFTYANDGREVSFTSTSKNATTFAWDFGDGATSTDQNPVHTYEAYGDYTVKLKVTGEGGEATSLPDVLTLAKSSNVVIDGNFSEWADIAEVTVPEKFGTITSVKVDYDATRIYFYVEGTADLSAFFDLYINTDNDPATGYFSGWYPEGYGADYLVEGDFREENDADIFQDNEAGEVTDWGWTVTSANGTNSVKSSDMKTVGTGNGIEFSIVRAAFINLASKFSFALVDVDGAYLEYDDKGVVTYDSRPDTSESWATLGSFPKDNTATSKLVEVDLMK
jgi:PKD repeat protein